MFNFFKKAKPEIVDDRTKFISLGGLHDQLRIERNLVRCSLGSYVTLKEFTRIWAAICLSQQLKATQYGNVRYGAWFRWETDPQPVNRRHRMNITPAGTFNAGCHRVPYEESLRIAKLLKLAGAE